MKIHNVEQGSLKIKKRGIWGGYEINKIGGCRPYFWFGDIKGKYLLSLTEYQAKKLKAFLNENL